MDEEKKSGFKFSYLIILILAVVLIFLMFSNRSNPGAELQSSTQVEQLIAGTYKNKDGQSEQMSAMYYKNGVAYILVKGSKYEKSFPSYADYHFYYESADKINDFDKLISVRNKELETEGTALVIKSFTKPDGINYWNIIYIVFMVVVAGLILFMMFKLISSSNKGALSFGHSRAKAYTSSKVRFSDVAGTEEEKEELREIVEFLKSPKKFTALGARIPKGVLLVGRPGTGKTLLARAVAGEANVPFISISGSDFVEMFVGVGASRVRDLFDQAKKNKPCIVFIDEIDAVGRQRGAGLGGGNDEREQTLNQLLVEMDGFEPNEGIIVLAATNRSDVLDPALLRPGRFDRQIYVNIPDVKGREGILKVHAKNKPIDESVDFKTLAKITVGFTGADIENMLNEAAILAARENRPKIIMSDITEGINKVTMGPQKKSRLVTERDRKITAYHEAGHAILGKLLPNCDEVQEVSIIPRGAAGGYTMSRPENDNSFRTREYLMDEIAMCMGGRISEEIIFKDITTGASADINQATKIAHAMVYDFGMSKNLGFLSLGDEQQVFIGRDYQQKRDFSEKLASEADDEIRTILDYNYKRAKKILSENIELLNEMATLLLDQETINSDEVNMLMKGMKAEEIAQFMEKREKERREKEKAMRAEMEKQARLESYQKKVAEGQKLLAEGIITQEEYNSIVKTYEEYKKGEEIVTTQLAPKKVKSLTTKKINKENENKQAENKNTELKEEKKAKTIRKKSDSDKKGD